MLSLYSLSILGTWLAFTLLDMFPSLWSKENEKKRRRIVEEDTNREGHWYRDFSVRMDSWPIIEHWAKEHGYRLVAMKGRRRLYRKGDNPNTYTTFLDIRHDEGRIVMAGWITVGFRMRALQLFLVPSELLIQPFGGWQGIAIRRSACRDFNALLLRMRQTEIMGSRSFHISDIDHSTLLLAFILLVPLHAFLIIQALKLEVRVGLSNILLSNIAMHLQLLLGSAIGVLSIHHFGVARLFQFRWVKALSVSLFFLGFSALTVFFGTRTVTENLYAKMTHYCFVSSDEARCFETLDQLSSQNRASLAQRSDVIKKHLNGRKY